MATLRDTVVVTRPAPVAARLEVQEQWAGLIRLSNVHAHAAQCVRLAPAVVPSRAGLTVWGWPLQSASPLDA